MAGCTGYGMLGSVGIQFQNSYGTLLTNSLHYVPIVNESLNFGIEQLPEPGMYARIAQNPIHAGFQSVEGSMNMMAGPNSIGHFLKSAIGLTSTTSDTGKFIHVFNARTADWDCKAATDLLTAVIDRDVGSAGVYYDLAGNSLTIGINNGELMTTELSVIGAGFSKTEGVAAPTFPGGTPFKWDQVSASYNSAAIEDISELTIVYNNNLEATYTMANTRAPTRIKRTGSPSVEISGTMLFTTHSYWLGFENQLELPLELNFVGQETPNVLNIFIPKFRMSEYTVNMADQGLIEASFTGVGIYDTTSNYDLQITLTNTQAVY